MASPIEDVKSLEDQTVSDQMGRKIGKIKDIYTVSGGEEPAWVTIESTIGLADHRLVFVPIARLKQEDGELRVPYSVQHVQGAPEIEPEQELSENDERVLRDYYAIDLADQEVRTDNEDSYASRVSDDDGQPEKLDS